MTLTPRQENGATRSGADCLDAELLASYVDGRTTPDERITVEAHIARCEDCYFAFSETAQEQQVQSPEPLPHPRRWMSRVAGFTAAGLAAAAALVIAVEVLGPFSGRIGRTQDLDRLTTRIRELENQLAHERERSANTTGQTAAAVQQLPQALPVTPIFALTPGMLRDGGTLTRVVIRPNDATVRFRLLLAGPEYPSYRAVFYDADGEEVWAVSKLRVDPREQTRALTAVVPSDLLSPGDYQIKVSGIVPDRRTEGIATYSLRVTPR
jgi:hypothetical protein